MTVFKVVSPVTVEPESTKLTVEVPSLVVPLAIAETSFNWKSDINI